MYNYGNYKTMDSYFNKAIGDTLRDIRIEKGYSLTKVSDKLGYPLIKQTLSKYELGTIRIRTEAFFKLADFYEISPEDLYNRITIHFIKDVEKHIDNFKQNK